MKFSSERSFAYTASLLSAVQRILHQCQAAVSTLCLLMMRRNTVLRTGRIPQRIVQYIGSFTGKKHIVDTASRRCKSCTRSYRVIIVDSAIGCSSWWSRGNSTVGSRSLTAGCWWAVSDRLQVVDVHGRWSSRPGWRLGKTAEFSSTTCHRSR